MLEKMATMLVALKLAEEVAVILLFVIALVLLFIAKIGSDNDKLK